MQICLKFYVDLINYWNRSTDNLVEKWVLCGFFRYVLGRTNWRLFRLNWMRSNDDNPIATRPHNLLVYRIYRAWPYFPFRLWIWLFDLFCDNNHICRRTCYQIGLSSSALGRSTRIIIVVQLTPILYNSSLAHYL